MVVSKEPEAVITSTAEPFRKIASFHEMAKCLSVICVCMCVNVCVCMCFLRAYSVAVVVRGSYIANCKATFCMNVSLPIIF